MIIIYATMVLVVWDDDNVVTVGCYFMLGYYFDLDIMYERGDVTSRQSPSVYFCYGLLQK